MKSKWIWYPDDFTFDLYHRVMYRRAERENLVPPMWRTEGAFDCATFCKKVVLKKTARVKLYSEGTAAFHLGNFQQYGLRTEYDVPAGETDILVKVYNPGGLPCLYLESEEPQLNTDPSWSVGSGNAHFVPAESGEFFDRDLPPSKFVLPVRAIEPEKVETLPDGTLFDFGRETMAFLKISAKAENPRSSLRLCLGESRQEALDTEECYTLEYLDLGESGLDGSMEKIGDGLFRSRAAKAFRYVYIQASGTEWTEFGAEYEYAELERKGDFSCQDDELNRIYAVSYDTMELTTREFFLDGIKRDRWLWSGDMRQSILMNCYSFFDNEVVKRTLVALGGKHAPECHVNYIMDYTFYWILSIRDTFEYSGDVDFLRRIYPKAEQYLQFCLSRRNAEGFLEGLEGDWVFVDWADIDNRGEVCLEQILFWKSLVTLAEMAKLTGREGGRYSEWADSLKRRIDEVFWIEERGCYAHGRTDGKLDEKITRYSNIFAILTGFADSCKREKIVENVLINDAVQQIVTPYMKFYELSAIGECGRGREIVSYVKQYWGGMLKEGATSFWELYDERESGTAHYAMYGRKYAKSLCHAWGASPLYLFGKYVAGVRPETPGYGRFYAEPCLDALPAFSAKIPANGGEIRMDFADGRLTVFSTKCPGALKIAGSVSPVEILPGRKYEFKVSSKTE